MENELKLQILIQQDVTVKLELVSLTSVLYGKLIQVSSNIYVLLLPSSGGIAFGPDKVDRIDMENSIILLNV